MSPALRNTLSWCLVLLGVNLYVRNQVLITHASASLNDFKHLYVASYLAWVGGDFFNVNQMLGVKDQFRIPGGINPFVYPPFFAIVLLPMCFLTFPAAWTVFTALSHIAFFASIAILIDLFRTPKESRVAWWGFWLIVSALFFPLSQSYSAGQMNTFMLLIIVSSLWCLIHKRTYWCGIILGLGFAIKVSPAFLLVYLAWKREWRALGVGIATIAVTSLISLMFFGWSAHAGFLNEAADMGYGSSTWAEHGMHYHIEPHNQAPAAMWYRLFTIDPPRTNGVLDSAALAKGVSYLTALGVLAFLLINTGPHSGRDLRLEYAFWSIGMLLLPSLMWDHYLVQAFLLIAVAARMLRDGNYAWCFLLALGIILLALPMIYNQPLFQEGFLTVGMNAKLLGLLLVVLYTWKHRSVSLQS